MEAKPIVHYAEVKGVGDSHIIVALRADESRSCSSCALAGACGGNAKSSEIRIEIADGVPPEAGSTVKVGLRPGATRYATFLLLTLPLIDFLAVAVICTAFGLADWITGLLSIAASAFCFIQLYISRRRLRPVWFLITDSTDNLHP